MLSMKSGVEVAESRCHYSRIFKILSKNKFGLFAFKSVRFDWIASKHKIVYLVFVIYNLENNFHLFFICIYYV